MKKILTFIVVIIFTISANFLQAQHLFSVSYNELSSENVTNLKSQIPNSTSQIPNLSLTKNNEDKNVYAISLSSVHDTKIILLNEDNGNHVVITPSEEAPAEFQLAPFFIEELRQSVLGNANHYLVMESSADFSVQNIASVEVSNENVFIPQYFYGQKEDVKEALPKDRLITNIFKETPHLILVDPADPEMQRYAAQWEEERSYYVYMYQLPNGMLCIFDEHFISNNTKSSGSDGYYNLAFNLSGEMTDEQREATEYALELWGEQLGGRVTVDISVVLTPLENGILGSSYKQPHYLNPENNTYYCSALGNQLAGYNFSSQLDIRIEMNSTINFHYGVAGKTGNTEYDYLTIMLHEISHGLGFSAIISQNGAYTYNPGGVTDNPGIFERQLFQGLNGPCMTELTMGQRAALIISGNLYAGAPGSHLLEANGGERVKMYAPSPYSGGSNVSHWDNSVSFPTFMKPQIGKGASYALHTFGDRKLGLMFDIGWTVPEPNPNARLVTFMDNYGKGEVMTQQFLPGVSKKIKPNTFKREGYTALNWNTLPDGTGMEYERKDPMTLSENLTLYAQWEPKTYTLQFNANGGTVQPNTKQVTFDAPIGELPIPKREGYNFWGWTIAGNLINKETIWNYPKDNQARASWAPIGIEEIQNTASLQIIPNPASQSIELRVTSYGLRVENIEFYNNLGQLVKNVPFGGEISNDVTIQKIDISDLTTGVYIVKAGDNAVKLIVQ